MRNKIQHLICICILICSVSSCVFAGKDILYGHPKGFVNNYSGSTNNLDQMIKMDGYYQADVPWSGDMLSITFMLYRDGSIYNPLKTYPGSKIDPDLTLPYNQSWKRRWGSYQICDSNIYVQTIEQIEWYYVTHNFIFEIINDTILLYKPIIRKNAKNETIKVFDYFTGTAEFHFHPFTNRMDSTCWVKNKKWFWKDKDAYKAYKNELKERKKHEKQSRDK